MVSTEKSGIFPADGLVRASIQAAAEFLLCRIPDTVWVFYLRQYFETLMRIIAELLRMEILVFPETIGLYNPILSQSK